MRENNLPRIFFSADYIGITETNCFETLISVTKLKSNFTNANAVWQQTKEYEYIKIISLLQIMI